MRLMTAVMALILFSTSAYAIDTEEAFDDPELQARYEKIIDEVRCLKCQNQTIKDSNAFLASDLRREIRRMLEEGMTDAEIYGFLVDRYGDFALYNPRASGKTLVLWIVPAVLLLLGGLALANIVRRRVAMPIDGDEGDTN
ncbi:MAG: cytochrome c-type biogenesis protein CcmH [Woeseiaceae bacterium]|nr:cytochrome c-type biogenesis protein CcmH [Woeseiaceae bacterium]NIP20426.1 cytochrome c-type biogenesis protein CcmH [Woeseiaceae bacterium]NIS89315.1 cytochrome c-type biogenesis protein CcmH [Woeseiaceae bacterium]